MIPVYKIRDQKIKLEATDHLKTCALFQRYLKTDLPENHGNPR
jgi:hypothetical protein